MQPTITLVEFKCRRRPSLSCRHAVKVPGQNQPLPTAVKRPDNGHQDLLVIVHRHPDQFHPGAIQSLACKIDGWAIRQATCGVDRHQFRQQLDVLIQVLHVHGRP